MCEEVVAATLRGLQRPLARQLALRVQGLVANRGGSAKDREDEVSNAVVRLAYGGDADVADEVMGYLDDAGFSTSKKQH